MLLIVATVLGANTFSPEATSGAAAGPRYSREFQTRALSLSNAGAEIPLIETPSDADARAAYPLKSRQATSVVALDCTVIKGGAIANCKINRADPDNRKLEAAALRLSRHFKVVSTYPSSAIMLFMQFSGKVDRCLQPFCLPDLIKPPPVPPKLKGNQPVPH